MESRRYSVRELLDLRKLRISSSLAYLASNDKDLVDIVRNKNTPRGSCRESSSTDRTDRKSKSDSSTESDEVVFKGKSIASRRSAKVDPITISPIPKESSTAQMDWKYRGRGESEVSAREPLSAPTEFEAQKSEGFKRFYKAVVSPTHVRVTAGGRIVPNTRGPPSPTTKRPSDKDRQTAPLAPDESALPLKPSAPFMPQPFPFMHPAFPGAMHPMQMQAMAAQMASIGYSMMPPGFPYTGMQMPNGVHKSASTPMTNGVDKSDNHAVGDRVLLSPPEQFDRSKPFMLNNGQMVMPMPGMFPPQFPGYFGMPPTIPGQGMTHPMMMPPGMSMPPFMGNLAAQTHNGSVPTRTAPPPSPTTVSVKTATKPPKSSIRFSEVTKNQLFTLRNNLKSCEDQLQYNRHQVDEKAMMLKVEKLKFDILEFSRMQEVYERHEREQDAADAQLKKPSMTSSARSSSGQFKLPSHSEESKESKATSDSHGPINRMMNGGKERCNDTAGLNSTKSADASYDSEDAGRYSFPPGNVSKRSGLPSGAALAAPFQPRASSLAARPDEEDTISRWERKARASLISVRAPPIKTTDTKIDIDSRLRGAGSTLVDGNRPSASRDASQIRGSPYLVGFGPRHGNGHVEYEYGRQLTGEELKARQQYWGRGPRAAGIGLPKYDGKDFYPPSPTKSTYTPSEVGSVRRHFKEPMSAHESHFGAPRAAVEDGLWAFREAQPRMVSSAGHIAPNLMAEAVSGIGQLQHVSEDVGSSTSSSVGQHIVQSADQHERRTPRAGNKLADGVLKRGLHHSDVLPSTTNTARPLGFSAPHKIGHSTAAIVAPTFLNTVGESSRSVMPIAMDKERDAIEEALANSPTSLGRVGEDVVPGSSGSLEQTFRNIVNKTRASLSPRWET